MDEDLETKTILESGYKSKGERKIAEVLDKYKITYKYESPIIIQDYDNKQRIWYPNFYLPDYGIYLEYYGVNGSGNYDNGRTKKDQTYQKMNLDIISIESQDINSNLESYIINEIYRIQKNRYSSIKAKIYRLRTISKMRY